MICTSDRRTKPASGMSGQTNAYDLQHLDALGLALALERQSCDRQIRQSGKLDAIDAITN